MCEYFVMAHVFGSVSVYVAFYLMLALGTQGHGFESKTLFLGGCGFQPPFLWGGGILFGLVAVVLL